MLSKYVLYCNTYGEKKEVADKKGIIEMIACAWQV
jgi:hypothetical protein